MMVGMLGMVCLVGLFQRNSAAVGFGEIVFDPTNYAENLATAISTFTTMEKTIEILKWTLEDLKTLETLPAIAQVTWRLEGIMRLLTQMRHLVPFDPERVQAMFDLLYPDEPICTQEGLIFWQEATRRQVRLGLLDSQTADGLISQLSAIGEVFEVIHQVMSVLGSVRGLQLSAQLQSLMIPLQALLPVMNGTFHRAMTHREAFDLTRATAHDCIRQDIRQDLPHRNAFGLPQ